eukprot:1157066-Pelagomonas_calceolata.AAC.6
MAQQPRLSSQKMEGRKRRYHVGSENTPYIDKGQTHSMCQVGSRSRESPAPDSTKEANVGVCIIWLVALGL